MDTRNKRASVILHGLPFRGIWPWPSGGIGEGDRKEIAFLYHGLSEDETGTASDCDQLHLLLTNPPLPLVLDVPAILALEEDVDLILANPPLTLDLDTPVHVECH